MWILFRSNSDERMGGAQGRELPEREASDTWTARTCVDCGNVRGCVGDDQARSSIISKKGFQPAGTSRKTKPPAYVCLRDSEAHHPSPGVPLTARKGERENDDGTHVSIRDLCGRDESAVAWVSGLHEEQAQPGLEEGPTWKARAEELHKELDHHLGTIAKIYSPRAVGSCVKGSGDTLHSPRSLRSPPSPCIAPRFLAVSIKEQE
jgi:hypothetical protein